MEHTQEKLNEHLNLNQFSSISWSKGFPMFIIEFIAVITGNPKDTALFFDRILKSVHLLTSTDIEKQVKQDVKVKKALHMTQSLIDNKSVFSNESFESLLSDHMMPMPPDSPDQHHKISVNQEH